MVQRVFNVCLDFGHGRITKNLDGDENGFDICPTLFDHKNPFPQSSILNYEGAGHIVDDVS
jgi:hypothetical protein